MDNKSLELYYEEQRQLTKDLKTSVDSLLGVFSQKVAVELEPQESIKIDGSVQVNTEKQVEVSNLQEVVTELQTLSKTLDQTIKDNKVTVPDEVVVKNIAQAKQDTIKISNLTELAEYFSNLTRSIEDNQPIVNVTKQVVEFPTSAKNPISVRLSDGKSFYKAINTAISGGFSSAGLATTAKQDAIITAIENSADNPSTSSVTSVADATASTQLLASNTSRKEAVITNDSTAVLYVAFGETASSTNYSARLIQYGTVTTDYTGQINGAWASDAGGSAQITELT